MMLERLFSFYGFSFKKSLNHHEEILETDSSEIGK